MFRNNFFFHRTIELAAKIFQTVKLIEILRVAKFCGILKTHSINIS